MLWRGCISEQEISQCRVVEICGTGERCGLHGCWGWDWRGGRPRYARSDCSGSAGLPGSTRSPSSSHGSMDRTGRSGDACGVAGAGW